MLNSLQSETAVNRWSENSGKRSKMGDAGKIRPAILTFCVATLAPCIWLLSSRSVHQDTPRTPETIQFVQTQSAPRDLVQQQRRRKLKAQKAEPASPSPGSDFEMDFTGVPAMLDDRQKWIEQPLPRIR